MAITIRKSSERGYFNYSWLKTYHTFSFGQYYDPQYIGFRALRVINEDRVTPGVGFPMHSHRDMEIISIILSGSLAHQDDMGNGSVLRPGDVQLMSAGKGVTHSETNASDSETAHFLQIWIVPEMYSLEPSYQEQFFEEARKKNQWCLIASKEGDQDSLRIHQNAAVYLADMDANQNLKRQMVERRQGWLQVIEGDVTLNGKVLDAGDGAAISNEEVVEIAAQVSSKLLFIELS